MEELFDNIPNNETNTETPKNENIGTEESAAENMSAEDITAQEFTETEKDGIEAVETELYTEAVQPVHMQTDEKAGVYAKISNPVEYVYTNRKPEKVRSNHFWKTVTAMLVAICLITSSFAIGTAVGAADKGEKSVYTIQQAQTPDYSLLTQNTPLEKLDVPSVIQKLNPSVVDIIVTTSSGKATAAGFIFTEDGYIITCGHVVAEAEDVTVYLFNDPTPYPAEVIGFDIYVDIGVIKVNLTGLSAVEIGEGSKLVPGEEVVAIGTPYEMALTHTATAGRVSAIRENYSLKSLGYTMDVIQHTASINPGNSGGPLINMYGQVVGINSSKIMYDQTATPYEDIGFAVLIDSALPLIESIINNGKVVRPQIGITGQTDITVGGVIVREITEGGAASKSNLQVDDIITHIDGIRVETINSLISILGKYKEGDSVELTVDRNGETINITLTLQNPTPAE